MREHYQAFAGAGLAVAAIAVALSAWLGGGVGDQRTGIVAAVTLALGDVAAALWAAGAAERGKNPTAWARVGLIAAILSFVGLWLIVIPLSLYALGADGTRTAMAAAVALAAGALIVWATHRLAWRRFAPKAGAK